MSKVQISSIFVEEKKVVFTMNKGCLSCME